MLALINRLEAAGKYAVCVSAGDYVSVNLNALYVKNGAVRAIKIGGSNHDSVASAGQRSISSIRSISVNENVACTAYRINGKIGGLCISGNCDIYSACSAKMISICSHGNREGHSSGNAGIFGETGRIRNSDSLTGVERGKLSLNSILNVAYAVIRACRIAPIKNVLLTSLGESYSLYDLHAIVGAVSCKYDLYLLGVCT